MKIELSNFELTFTKGSNPLNLEYFAEVDVTTETGFLLWKKTITERRGIRRKFGGIWHFVDNGEYTPGSQAEKLARSWEAQTGELC